MADDTYDLDNLREYLETRIEEIGESPSSLSTRLGWGVSYIRAVMRGQFKPSPERCDELSKMFGDDPNILRALVGYYKPPKEDARENEVLGLFRSLNAAHQKQALEYLNFLRQQEISSRGG